MLASEIKRRLRLDTFRRHKLVVAVKPLILTLKALIPTLKSLARVLGLKPATLVLKQLAVRWVGAANSAIVNVGDLAMRLARAVQRRGRFFKIARAVKIGPLVIGRSGDIEALSRGASIISPPLDGELGRTRIIFKCGPVAMMHARHVDEVIRPLQAFEAEVRKFRAARRSSGAALGGGEGRRRDRRSILFIHNCYYNFFYLAAALRRRGWDAVSASIEDPDGPNGKYYHGEDVNLFDPDPERFRHKLFEFFAEVEDRFGMLHFHGVGCGSIFPAYFDSRRSYDGLPVDFVRLSQRGIKIGYTVSGCNDGASQSSVAKWSGVCDRCVWQDQPQACSDTANLAWGRKVHTMCDVVDTGGSPALDWKGRPDKIFRDPLTFAIDSEIWRPDLQVPDKYRLKRTPGELIVYHAVGNYEERSRNGRNVKGTPAILAAIDRIRSEGVPVKLEFVTNVPSKDVRFIQVQADVVVDQLNYGRYGAQAGEAMMLGRPTICYMNKDEPPGASKLGFVEECPIVSATEESVYAVLKALLLDEDRRRKLAKASRDFAVKWHSADACAERFEQVYDRLMRGLPPSEHNFAASC